MPIQHIAGYKFITLNDLAYLQRALRARCESLGLKGTILLSPEGINVQLAGEISAVAAFKEHLKKDMRFADMIFRVSHSSLFPFRRLKVKLKREIITLRQKNITPHIERAPSITPHIFKQWLDEKRKLQILDTRNDYEIQFGTFSHAINLHLKHFSEFPQAINPIEKNKPVVMFCTGGIRCEKAALYLLKNGYENVYQLEGGILNYFQQVGSAHYHGDCYVFDERVVLKPSDFHSSLRV